MKRTQNCTYYLVRHAKSIWNEKGLIQGHKDSPLSQMGKIQAYRVAKELQKVKFDIAFSSDLLRAKESAEIIVSKKLKIHTTNLLRERYYAKYEGKSYEVGRAYDLRYEILKDEEKFLFKADDVESDEEIVLRIITFFKETTNIYANKTILVVTHADILHKFLIYIGFGSHSNFPINFIQNTAYVKLFSDGENFVIQETKRITLP